MTAILNKYYSFIIFSFLINAVILLYFYMSSLLDVIFSSKHYLDLYKNGTICSESLLILFCFTSLYLVSKIALPAVGYEHL